MYLTNQTLFILFEQLVHGVVLSGLRSFHHYVACVNEDSDSIHLMIQGHRTSPWQNDNLKSPEYQCSQLIYKAILVLTPKHQFT